MSAEEEEDAESKKQANRETHKSSTKDFEFMFSNVFFTTSHFDVQADISIVQKMNRRQLLHQIFSSCPCYIHISEQKGETRSRYLRGKTKIWLLRFWEFGVVPQLELSFIHSAGVRHQSADLISSVMPEEIDVSQIKEMDQFQIVIVVRPTFARNTELISTSSL